MLVLCRIEREALRPRDSSPGYRMLEMVQIHGGSSAYLLEGRYSGLGPVGGFLSLSMSTGGMIEG